MEDLDAAAVWVQVLSKHSCLCLVAQKNVRSASVQVMQDYAACAKAQAPMSAKQAEPYTWNHAQPVEGQATRLVAQVATIKDVMMVNGAVLDLIWVTLTTKLLPFGRADPRGM